MYQLNKNNNLIKNLTIEALIIFCIHVGSCQGRSLAQRARGGCFCSDFVAHCDCFYSPLKLANSRLILTDSLTLGPTGGFERFAFKSQ